MYCFFIPCLTISVHVFFYYEQAYHDIYFNIAVGRSSALTASPFWVLFVLAFSFGAVALLAWWIYYTLKVWEADVIGSLESVTISDNFLQIKVYRGWQMETYSFQFPAKRAKLRLDVRALVSKLDIYQILNKNGRKVKIIGQLSNSAWPLEELTDVYVRIKDAQKNRRAEARRQ